MILTIMAEQERSVSREAEVGCRVLDPLLFMFSQDSDIESRADSTAPGKPGRKKNPK